MVLREREKTKKKPFFTCHSVEPKIASLHKKRRDDLALGFTNRGPVERVSERLVLSDPNYIIFYTYIIDSSQLYYVHYDIFLKLLLTFEPGALSQFYRTPPGEMWLVPRNPGGQCPRLVGRKTYRTGERQIL